MLLTTFVSLIFFHTFIDIYSVPDIEAYYLEFIQGQQYSWEELISGQTSYIEIGFLLLLKVVSSIGGDFRMVLLICSLLIITPYYLAIRKYSPYAGLSVLLILLTTYNQSLFVLRQHIAIAITIYSYQYVINKNLWKFMSAMIIAFLFHKTAMIFIPVYYIYNIKSQQKIMGILAIITILLSLFFDIFYNDIGNELGYNAYLEDSENKTNYKGLIIGLFIAIVYIFYAKKTLFTPGIFKLMTILCMLNILANLLGIGLPVTGRLSLYYSVIAFIVIPNTIKHISGTGVKICYTIAILFIYFYTTFLGSSYQFIKDITLNIS